MPSRTCARAAAISFEGALPGREYCGSPPATSTMHGAPSALASSTARRLSSRASMRCVGREHAAAAIARQFEPGVAHRTRGALEPDASYLIAPGIDGADVFAR